MKAIKSFFKTKVTRVWFIVTAIVLALMITVTYLASTVFFRAISTFLGGERRGLSGGSGSNAYYTTEYDTKEKAREHGNEVNRRVAEEGIVLLKNEKETLPLKTSKEDKKKISVFGKNSVNLAYSGSGSGGGDTSSAKTIYDSLTEAGYEYNAELKAFYENNNRSGNGRAENPKIESGHGIAGFSTGETPINKYSGLESSYSDSDLALVVITRIGGEGYDLPTTMKQSFDNSSPVDGAVSSEDHYLELDQNEQDLLQMVCEKFDKVVLVINSSTPMELGFLDAEEDGDGTMNAYDYASHISAALWIGYPGNSGIMALGDILNGTVNPSGKLVDTYAKDFTKMPSYNNVGIAGTVGTDGYTQNGKTLSDRYFSDYEEGIYVGYRYYETRYETEGKNGENWYSKNVAYPFGYGLSYTDFSWEVVDKQPSENSPIGKDTEFSVTVKVHNDGNVAGKDVVQIYLKAPYTGKIEKASKVLVGYAKTDLIQPGSDDEVTVTFTSYDFSSFDYQGSVENGYKGYLLEKGDYSVIIGRNAHEEVASISYAVEETIKFETDHGTTVTAIFDDVDDQLGTVLSRSDWEGTWPRRRTAEEKNATDELLREINSTDSGNPLTKDSEEVKNANLSYSKVKKTSSVQLWEMIGKSYDDPKWEELLKSLTISSMFEMCSNMGSFGTISIDYIGKPKTIETDGPNGFINFLNTSEVFGGCLYGSECVLAATWNKDLAYELGAAVGSEGIVGNTNDGTPYSGWYAPGVNIHRTPFGGRNSEYYSEDGMLTGMTAASVIKGAASKGVYTYMKHFAVNEQETHRAGVCTWLTEQALREIYLKPFEIAVKQGDGKTNAIMSSFNRIGTKWTGGDYRLLTTVLRDEWGFRGAVITDFADKAYMNNKQMTYAGGDIRLGNLPGKEWVDTSNPVDLYMLKKSAKNVLYVVANSCAMNGIGEGVSLNTLMPYWQIGLIVFDCVLAVGFGIWGGFAIHKWRKKSKSEKAE